MLPGAAVPTSHRNSLFPSSRPLKPLSFIPKPATDRAVGCSRRVRAFLAAVVIPLLALLGDSAWAGRVNFAKYQAVTASGQSGDYDPGFAVDGLVSNFHSFRTANTTAPKWLQVNFPRAVTVASAHLYLGLDNDAAKGGLPSFKIQYYNGSAWVDVPGSSVTGNTASERSVIFSSAPTSDRFRLYTDEDGSRTIREFALFPPNLIGAVEQGYPIGTDVRLNLAFERPAVASSISSKGYPKLAVDGYVDDASRWICAATTGQTLEVNLLDTNVIGSAHVYTGLGTTSVLAAFVLEYWTGTAWAAIPGATITGNTSTARVIAFSSNVSTSKIRLRTTSASAGRVKELLVFPPRTGGYPLGQDVQTSPPPNSKWDDFSDSSWRLKNGGPDLRLALVDGQVVYVSNTSGSAALEWQLLLNHRDGSYRVRHAATGKCLALGEISKTAGKAVVVEPYTGMPHQDWVVQYQNASQFRLINVYSGLAVYPKSGVWDSGNPMVVATPSSSVLQLWQRAFYGYYPKKGLGGFVSSYDQFHASWSYNWGRSTTTVLPFDHTFNPMQWGNYFWSHGGGEDPVDVIRGDLQSNSKPTHVMGFNEPDHTDQANMTTDQAIALWPRLEALGAPLVGPCAARSYSTSATDWVNEWAAKADAQGFRRDYVPYHWYSSPNVDKIISDLNKAYTAYGRPIWLTEFSTISWDGKGAWTKADNYNCLAEFMWRAESLPWLKRYALFQFTEGTNPATDPANAPRSNARKSDGTLTPFGELYAGWDGVTSVLPAKAYHVHNRGGYKRIQNPAVSSTVALVDPGNSDADTRWFLTPGITANTYRLLSARDARPLRSSGTTVDLGTVGETITSVEWRLTADKDGWYFIDHPLSKKRLKDNGNGTLTMVAISTTTDSVKWRFVVPAVVVNTPPVLAAIPAKTVNQGVRLTFTASAADADLPANTLTYSLSGAPTGASIDASTGVFTWTPTAAQASASYDFSVLVSDGTVTDSQPVSVTVTDLSTLAVSASPPTWGTVTGEGTFPRGSSQNVTVTATANKGFTFTGWSEGGTVVSTAASYTFTLTTDRTLVANFGVNFAPVGKFFTVLTSSLGDALGNGGLAVSIGKTGVFTGKLMQGATTLAFKGQIDGFGQGTVMLVRKGLPTRTLTLQFDSRGVLTATLTAADRGGLATGTSVQTFSAKNPLPAAQVGRYTLIYESGATAGIGYGAATVAATGGVKIAGVLADGAKFSLGTKLSVNSADPSSSDVMAYAKTHGGKGFFQIAVVLSNAGGGNGAGAVFRPAGLVNKTTSAFTGGFYDLPTVSLLPYTPPQAGVQMSGFTVMNGAGTFGLDATAALTNTVTFTMAPKGTATSATEDFKLKLDPKTGLYRGTRPNPTPGGKPLFFGGAFSLTDEIGFGISHDATTPHAAFIVPGP